MHFPDGVRAAINRAARAELGLNRVYPLFATKLWSEPSDARSDSQASLELEAFVAQMRVAHRAALQSLHFWRQSRANAETVEAAYESLAVLIEGFAKRVSLDAAELDS